MIIGIDATRANKPQKTGVEWYAFFMIRELVQLNREITFRLYFNSAPEPALMNLGPNVEYRQLKWPFVYLWTQIRLSLEMLLNPPDVLFVPASIIPLISPKRTVTTIHDVAYEAYHHDLSWKARMYLRLATYLAKWLCPKIITVSEFSKSEIMKYYRFPADKIEVIYLGIKVPEQLPAKTATDPYLLFIGRLESKKNIAQLIRVFHVARTTDWGKKLTLHLIGYPSRGWPEAEKLIHDFGLEQSVKRLGWVPEEIKFQELRNASIYIHLAKYEGFGYPLLEAMAMETPILANRATCLPEICSDAALYTDANNVEETVGAIKSLLTDYNLRQDLIQKGLARQATFRYPATAAATLKVLTSL